ncbi:MAG: energy transducer TonB [Gemmatimonadales bacterium]
MRATSLLPLVLLSGSLGPAALSAQIEQPRCTRLSAPRTLPPVSSVLDSTLLARALVAGGDHELVASVATTADGRPRVVRIGSWVDAPDSLAILLEAALQPSVEVDAPSIRVRLRLGGRPAITLERSELCTPVLMGGPQSRTVTIVTSSPSPVRTRSASIRMRISALGVVLSAELTTSTGVPELDRETLANASQLEFRPATLDGRPVEVWLARGRAELVR